MAIRAPDGANKYFFSSMQILDEFDDLVSACDCNVLFALNFENMIKWFPL